MIPFKAIYENIIPVTKFQLMVFPLRPRFNDCDISDSELVDSFNMIMTLI